MTRADDVVATMEGLRNDDQRQVLMRFFKTGPGEYGHGDDFLGLRVPQTRAVALQASDMPLDEAIALLHCRWHEVRLCGLLVLVRRFERSATARLADDPQAIAVRDTIVTTYLAHAQQANNWDLVDLSAPKLLGHWLALPTALCGDAAALHHDYKTRVLDGLSASDNLWLQRIAMVSTLYPTQHGDASWCLRYAERLLRHPHDLMHKAVGWMLREVGKHVDVELLRAFLREHIHDMPRTTLRYAIERLDADERQHWMSL